MNKNLIAFISIFFITLQALYFRSISLAPFPLLGLLIIIFTNSKAVNSKELKEFLPIFFLILISFIVGMFNFTYSASINFYLPTLFGWVLFPVALIYCKRFFNNDGVNFYRVLRWVLILHLTFFYIQYFSYTLFNIKLDFLEVITGETQRTGANKLKDFGSGLIRSAGLYTEPGSYTVYIYILLAMCLIIKRKIDFVITIALLSMFLSFSMTGVLLGLSYVLFYISGMKLKLGSFFNLAFILTILSGFLFYFSQIFFGPILNRFEYLQTDGSALQRFQGGFSTFLSENYFFTGLGIGFQHFNIKGTSVYLSGLYNLGFFGFLFFVIYLIKNILKNSKNIKLIFLIIPVFFSNISIVQIIFIFYISIFYSQLTKKN